jgi:DHA3 family tetracycline resistance protein-like MFS transporter
MDRRQRTTWRHMADTFREGIAVIRRQPMLLRVLAIGFFFGLFSEGWDRLSQAHLITTFGLGSGNIPAIVIFGGLSILGMAAGIVLTEIVRRTLDTSRPRAVAGALFGFTLTMVICMIAFGLSPSLVVALIAFFVFGQARGQVEPIWQIFTNQHVESHVRATVLSFISQTDAIGQMAGGPPVGLIGNASLRAVFIVCSVLLMPTLYLLQRVRRSAPPGAIILEADAAP